MAKVSQTDQSKEITIEIKLPTALLWLRFAEPISLLISERILADRKILGRLNLGQVQYYLNPKAFLGLPQ